MNLKKRPKTKTKRVVGKAQSPLAKQAHSELASRDIASKVFHEVKLKGVKKRSVTTGVIVTPKSGKGSGAYREVFINAGKRFRVVPEKTANGTRGLKLVLEHAGRSNLSSGLATDLLDAEKPIVDRLASLDIMPGLKLDGLQAKKVLRSFIDSTKLIVGSEELARQLFSSKDFDETGKTAEQLVKDGRSGRVLARIDALNSGPRG